MKLLPAAVIGILLYLAFEVGSAFLPGRAMTVIIQGEPCHCIALPNTADEAACRIQMQRAADAIEEAH